MTRARVSAAAAGIVTALLLQSAVVAPVVWPWAISLPAVLVAAVGLHDGPAAGLSTGFVAGLAADLGSTHPAGLLALCWLGVGLVCGRFADRRSVRRDAVLAGAVCAAAGVVAAVLIALTHDAFRNDAAAVSGALAGALPAALGNAVLALGVVPVTRLMLRTGSLRAPAPLPGALGGLALGARAGADRA